jgi:hypothetical protein
MQISIGADPELFLINENSKFISSIGKFGGTKRFPKPIGKSCYIQEDNVAVEFNIPPSSSKDEFVNAINFALSQLYDRAKELKLDLAFTASANFDSDQLKHPKAKIFGCDPDINAWTIKENPAPKSKDKSLRSAGGHVHVGCKEFAGYDIARAMDLFLGVPSLQVDGDLRRRELYGKAGAFRNKNYGMEYRTLSNFWVKHPKLISWVYDQTHEAIKFLQLGNRLQEEDGVEIQDCINNSNHSIMRGLIKRYGLASALQ